MDVDVWLIFFMVMVCLRYFILIFFSFFFIVIFSSFNWLNCFYNLTGNSLFLLILIVCGVIFVLVKV